MVSFGRCAFVNFWRTCGLTEIIADQKYNNLHGERAARLNSGQSIFKPQKPTLFIKILSPAFLYAPGVYLKRLDKISIDSVVNQRAWKEMLSLLTEEWKDFTLLVSAQFFVASFHYSPV